MKRLIGPSLAVLLSATAALAGTSTITVLDSTGATKTYAVTTNAGASFIQQMVTCDGTAAAQCAAVKPASTAAIATDPALVVAISPNNPVAATQSGTWNVTNISGTVSLPTGASTAALQPTTNAVAGTTTAGTTGTLAFGAVTTGAPTYTTANSLPLSLDTAGNLRVVQSGGGGAVTVADGADVTQGAKADAVCGTSTGTCSMVALTKFIASAVSGAIPAGSAIIGNVGSVAIPTGGATPTGNIAPANTTAVVVKASAGTLYGVQLGSIGSAPVYLKIYNSTSSCAGTPVKRFIIPAAATAANGAGSNISFGSAGVAFSTGITYCVSTDITDTNSGAPTANQVLINIDWN